jgi:hypothetical protein
MDVALISPVNPFDPRDGHRLAVLSDVYAALDNKLRLGVISFSYGDDEESVVTTSEHKLINAGGGGFPLRLLRGLLKGLPPSAERFYSEESRRELSKALNLWRPPVVIIDDASVGGFIPLIRDLLPAAKIVLRSHNVMHDVRSEQLQRAQGLSKPAVKLDCDRYIEFEKRAVQSCDAHWTITDADAARMLELYKRPAECLSVSIAMDRYKALRLDEGKKNGFVHVGTMDFRRRSDLCAFLTQDWPRVLGADDEAALTLAGELRGQNIPARNVTYTGRVKSDTDVYSRGRFALNFQSSPGGVKLKSLTSLAAGRTLVSTKEGVEGIDIASGREFLELEGFLSNPHLREILRDVRATQPIADAGRQYVSERHSRACVAKRFLRLLEGIPA